MSCEGWALVWSAIAAGGVALGVVLGRAIGQFPREKTAARVSESAAALPHRPRVHLHTWEGPRSREWTNKQAIGVYRCLHCGELERRVEADEPD